MTLPQDWEEVPLFKYLELVSSGVRQFQGTKKYIDTGSLETGKIIDSEDVEYATRRSRANMEVMEGDVLFAKMKDTEKVYLISKDDVNHLYSTGFAILRIKDRSKLLPKYIYFWLRTTDFQRLKNNESTGATQKAINETKLKKFKIKVPPIKTQEKIIVLLEKAEQIKNWRKDADALSKDYLKSVFVEMFGNPIINEKKWDLKPLSSFGEIKTGNTPPRKEPKYYGDYMDWIKSDNLNTPFTYITESEEKLSKEGVKVGRTAPANSILVTCIAGSLSCIGNAAITNKEVAFNQQINAIIPNSETDSFFLFYLLSICKKKVQNSSTNSMKGLLSKSKFEAMEMIKPPFLLQKRFGKIAEKFEKILSEQYQSHSSVELLFNSFMQKAFKGELV